MTSSVQRDSRQVIAQALGETPQVDRAFRCERLFNTRLAVERCMSTSTAAANKLVVRSFAIELLAKQMTIGDVAQVVDVSESTIKRWKKAFLEGGDAALHPKPRCGSQAKPTPGRGARSTRHPP
jgi:hypothetical protein